MFPVSLSPGNNKKMFVYKKKPAMTHVQMTRTILNQLNVCYILKTNCLYATQDVCQSKACCFLNDDPFTNQNK